METRPKIKLQLSTFDKVVEGAGFLMIFILWVLTFIALFYLPHTIPIHYNFAGKVDSFGDKSTLIFLPILATIIFIGLTILNKYPDIFNYAVTITESNAKQQYTYATKMIRFLKFSIAVIFALVTVFIYLSADGIINGIGYWFLPFVFLIICLPGGYYIAKSLKAK